MVVMDEQAHERQGAMAISPRRRILKTFDAICRKWVSMT